MIAKIDTHKIEHLSNIEIFVRDYNNLVESKLKQIIKTNWKSIEYLKKKKLNKLKKKMIFFKK